MSNPTVAIPGYNDYLLWKIVANNSNDTIASLNSDTAFAGVSIANVGTVTPSSFNQDSMGNLFCYSASQSGQCIIFKELQYIGGSLSCEFNDSTNPGTTYTVNAVPVNSFSIDYNTLAITPTA